MMRFAPSLKEQALLDELPMEERFHYAVPRICECEEVWSLGGENGWQIRDMEDKAVISIWPYRQMALEYAQGELTESTPICVSLEHFLYQLLRQCQDNDITMEICPAPGKRGYMISAAQLHEVLENMVETDSYFIEG